MTKDTPTTNCLVFHSAGQTCDHNKPTAKDTDELDKILLKAYIEVCDLHYNEGDFNQDEEAHDWLKESTTKESILQLNARQQKVLLDKVIEIIDGLLWIVPYSRDPHHRADSEWNEAIRSSAIYIKEMRDKL
jgi:hypothetical protein